MSNETLANLLHEDRSFPPPPEFAAQANAGAGLYAEAASDRLGFWADQARQLVWDTPFTEVLDWSNPPFARWFADGQLNLAYNCVDQHVEDGYGEQVAIHWVGEPGDTRTITYADLQEQVNKLANALAELGVGKGDRVAIYLPMVPEAAVAMLACARVGAVHSVVFGGFSAEALRSRIEDAEAKLVITADGGFRRGAPSALKPIVDEALAQGAPTIENVIVVKRTGQEVGWTEGRDHWWADVVDRQSPEHAYAPNDAEDPLFILYTSGTTGKPKGILHTSGGYLTQVAYTFRNVFDIKPDTDVYWCTADVGWVTGHSYIVYGPLANGATVNVSAPGILKLGGNDTITSGVGADIVLGGAGDDIQGARRGELVEIDIVIGDNGREIARAAGRARALDVGARRAVIPCPARRPAAGAGARDRGGQPAGGGGAQRADGGHQPEERAGGR